MNKFYDIFVESAAGRDQESVERLLGELKQAHDEAIAWVARTREDYSDGDMNTLIKLFAAPVAAPERRACEIEFLGLCENKAISDLDMRRLFECLDTRLVKDFPDGVVAYAKHRRPGAWFDEWIEFAVRAHRLNTIARTKLGILEAYRLRDGVDERAAVKMAERLMLPLFQPDVYLCDWVSAEQCRAWLKEYVDKADHRMAMWWYNFNLLLLIHRHNRQKALSIVDDNVLAAMMRVGLAGALDEALDGTFCNMAKSIVVAMDQAQVEQSLNKVGGRVWGHAGWCVVFMQIFDQLGHNVQAKILATAPHEIKSQLLGKISASAPGR